MDATQRYHQRLRLKAYEEAQGIYSMLQSTPAFHMNMDMERSMRLFLSVGAAELCPILVRGLNEPRFLAISKGVNSKLVALFIANWMLHFPLVREVIATPETLSLSLNVLVRVSNVCLILMNVALLLDEETPQSNKEAQNVSSSLTLLDMGLQYSMYEWDATFLPRVFEGMGLCSKWRTSACMVEYAEQICQRPGRGEDEKEGSCEVAQKMKIVCNDVTKILLGKMLQGCISYTETDGFGLQTVENNNTLKKIHNFCPGLVDCLVDKHMDVLSSWFEVHMHVYWPFYVASIMADTE